MLPIDLSEPARRPKRRPKRRRRRVLVVLAVLLALALAVVLIGPTLAAPFVRSALVRALEGEVDAGVEIDAVTLGWGGGVVTGLRLLADDDSAIASVERAELELDLWSALLGSYDAALVVTNWEVVARQHEDGTWDLAEIAGQSDASREGGDGRPPQARAPDDPSARDEPPSVRASVALTDGTLRLEGLDGDTTLRLAKVTCEVDGLDRPAPFRAEGELATAGLAPGPVTLEGELTAVPTGDTGPAGRASLRLAVGAATGLDTLDRALVLATDVTLDAGALEGKLDFDGALAALLALAGDALPLREGVALEGALTASFSIIRAADGAGRVSGALDLEGLAGLDGAGTPLDVSAIGSPRVRVDGSFDASSFELATLTAELGPVTLAGRAAVAGLDSQVSLSDAHFELDANLDSLLAALTPILEIESEELSGQLTATMASRDVEGRPELDGSIALRELALGDIAVDGASVNVAAHLVPASDSAPQRVVGALTSDGLIVSLGEGKSLEQADLSVDFTLEASALAADPRLEYRSQTGVLRARRVERGGDVWRVELEGSIERWMSDFATLMDFGGVEAAGVADAQFDFATSDEALGIQGSLLVEGLDVTLPPPTPEADRPRWTEERATLELDATIDDAVGRVDLARLALDSIALRGEAHGGIVGLAGPEATGDASPTPLGFDNLAADFTYLPDRLGPLLVAWLPGELSGSERASGTLVLDGALEDQDLEQLLASVRGTVDLGLISYRLGGLDVGGDVKLDVDEGRAKLVGELGANGGNLSITGHLGDPGDEDQGAQLSVRAKAIRANAELASLLSLAHPAFATLGQLDGADLGGLIECELDVAYAGALSMTDLENGWDALPKERLSGKGRLGFDEAVLRGSPFLLKLLDEFDEQGERSLSIDPIEFRIDGGRVFYESPWTWTIDGTKTTFAGSLGLDQSLDLSWNVPITKKLVKKHDFLEPLLGQAIAVPIRGTASRPKVELDGVLQDLAQKALRAQIEGELNELTGAGSEEDPAELLAEADRLWDEGEKKRAAKIYDRIRDDFSLSPVYLLNRDKIKKRRSWKPKKDKSEQGDGGKKKDG